MLEGKPAEYVRKTFKIKNDFTDEEESQVSTVFVNVRN